MLEHLFGSKTRVKLLQLFLNNPSQPFYLRELARRLKVQLNAVRREVNNLIKLDILKSVELDQDLIDAAEAARQTEAGSTSKPESAAKRGTRKYLIANTNFVLFPELKAMLLKAKLLVERNVVAQLEQMPRLQTLVLTGIFVGLEDFPTDILLVGNVNHAKVGKIIKSAEKDLDHSINYTILSAQEYLYRKQITDRFLYQIIEGEKIIVFDKLA
jgi:hypothetical protein